LEKNPTPLELAFKAKSKRSRKNPNASRKNPTPLELAFKTLPGKTQLLPEKTQPPWNWPSRKSRNASGKKTNASRKNPTALELALKAKSKRFREKPKCFPEEPNPIGTGLQGKVVTLPEKMAGVS
jgi:hypothetical protein